ncbi:MAG: serine/threonine-protein kinase [Polyangiaceae bacterium]
MVTQDPNVERAQARVGTWLRGKWHLDRLLGVGGMAAVFAATHRNHKRGAVKLLHPALNADPAARARFVREGYAANRVGHPGAVSVLDDDVDDDGTVFLVMELLEGRTVEALATSHPGERMPVEDVLAIADSLCDVLGAAHARGILHRDIKPENLFMTSDGSLRVLDFGIARLHEPGFGARATRTGDVFGTPAFMSPEQALGEHDRMDGRSDLWAVGATMWTLLTGKLVHEAETTQKLMLAAMTKPAPPIASLRPDLPREVAIVIDRALAFSPSERWADAAAMQRAVRSARASYVANHAAAPTLVSGARSAGGHSGSGHSGSGQLTGAPVSADAPTIRLPGPRRTGLLIAAAVTAVIGAIAAIVLFRGGSSATSGAPALAEAPSVNVTAPIGKEPETPPPPSASAAPTSVPVPISVVPAAPATHAGSPAGAAPTATASATATVSGQPVSQLAPKATGTSKPAASGAPTAAATTSATSANPFDRRQ